VPIGVRAGIALLASALLTGLLAVGPAARGEPAPLNVFAASSLTDIVNRLGEDFCVEQGGQSGCIRGVFGASSTLARQVARGAPADIYLTAHEEWMDFLESRQQLAPGTRTVFAGNRLVVIQAASAPPAADPIAALTRGRIALADPDHVPAGRYAREALASLGLWDTLAGRVVPTDNVRQALLLVARGEVSTGVVYFSDAVASARVAVVAVLPETLHSPIRYSAAAVRGGADGAQAFLRFLSGPRAKAALAEQGFEPPQAPGD